MLEAHRTVLTLLSPVFRAYSSEKGSWFNTGTEIVIRDVSRRSFRVMLEFFYKKDFNISNHFTNIEELFEILQVADRYQVEVLVELCKKSLLSFPMEIKSVVHIVKIAMDYKNLAPFAVISQEVIDRVMGFLDVELKTSADVMNFLARSDTDNPILEDSIKLELLKTMASRKCDKCDVDVVSKVTHENMIVGARVEVTKKSKFMYNSARKLEVGEQGKITRLSERKYTIVWDTYGEELEYKVNKDLHVPMKYFCKCNK